MASHLFRFPYPSNTGFFLERIPSILFLVRVSPAAKRVQEEKRSWGDTPQAPRQGPRPRNPLLKQLPKTSICEVSSTSPRK